MVVGAAFWRLAEAQSAVEMPSKARGLCLRRVERTRRRPSADLLGALVEASSMPVCQACLPALDEAARFGASCPEMCGVHLGEGPGAC